MIQRHRVAFLGLPRVTLFVSLMFILPWVGGCSSQDPVIMEKVVPPDVPGGTSDAVIAKPQRPKQGRMSRPAGKSIKSRIGGGEDK